MKEAWVQPLAHRAFNMSASDPPMSLKWNMGWSLQMPMSQFIQNIWCAETQSSPRVGAKHVGKDRLENGLKN